MYATKLDKIMTERKLSIADLNKTLDAKGILRLDPTAFAKYRKGKTGLNAKLSSNLLYPSVLERLCLALNVHSSELLEY